MALNFPRKPEIRLENAPLSEVVCQVRFPAILRILKEDPIDFQERTRGRFPELRVDVVSVRLPKPGSPEKPMAEEGARIFRFVTADESTTVSLAVDFFALSTLRYQHWDDYVNDLALTYHAVQAVYEPAYATRIGLRYVNRFTLSNTNVDSVDELIGLFQPDLTALLMTDGWTDPAEMLSQLLLTDDDAKLTLRCGFGSEKGENFFLLDFDYFEEGKSPLDNLLERLDHYHQMIHDAFRWCVPDDTLSRFIPAAPEVA